MTEEAKTCRWCGSAEHVESSHCPFVKALEFDPSNGQIITRVEFFSPVEMFGPQRVEQSPNEDDYPRKGRIA